MQIIVASPNLQPLSNSSRTKSLILATANSRMRMVYFQLHRGSINANANAETVYVNGYGGTTWENITKAYLEPLKAKTGLNVELVPDPSLAKLEAMVGEGKCDYHVIELEGANYMLAVEKGLLQEIIYHETIGRSKKSDLATAIFTDASRFPLWKYIQTMIALKLPIL